VRLAAAAAAPVEPVITDGTPVMPELRGRTLRQALATLAPLNVAVHLDGRGRVVEQSPAPGAPVEAETSVRLTLVGAAAR
jgi:beta-lactam-binding protein with PASTA domain